MTEATDSPGILHHLGAILYDLLLLLALLMVATTLVIVPLSLHGEQVSVGENILFRLYLVLVGSGYYLWFWTHGGQTLGMRSWRIRVVDSEGQAIRWGQAVRRYLAALVSWGAAGLGFIWILFDRDGCSWHDRLSGTYLVMTEKGNQTGG